MAHCYKTLNVLLTLVLDEQKSLQGVSRAVATNREMATSVRGCEECIDDWWYCRWQNGSSCIGEGNECARLWQVCWWLMVLQTTEWIVVRQRRQRVCAVVTTVLMIGGIADDRMDRHASERVTSVRGCDKCVDDWWYCRRQNGSSCIREGNECARLWQVCWWLMVLQTTEWIVVRERRQRVCVVCYDTAVFCICRVCATFSIRWLSSLVRRRRSTQQ